MQVERVCTNLVLHGSNCSLCSPIYSLWIIVDSGIRLEGLGVVSILVLVSDLVR